MIGAAFSEDLIHWEEYENKVHKTGYLVFSKGDPTQLLKRCEGPIVEPTEEWEINGPARNVTFAEGIVRFNGKWLLYYGAADKCIGLAEGEVSLD